MSRVADTLRFSVPSQPLIQQLGLFRTLGIRHGCGKRIKAGIQSCSSRCGWARQWWLAITSPAWGPSVSHLSWVVCELPWEVEATGCFATMLGSYDSWWCVLCRVCMGGLAFRDVLHNCLAPMLLYKVDVFLSIRAGNGYFKKKNLCTPPITYPRPASMETYVASLQIFF